MPGASETSLLPLVKTQNKSSEAVCGEFLLFKDWRTQSVNSTEILKIDVGIDDAPISQHMDDTS